jgi:glycosyl transferase family 2
VGSDPFLAPPPRSPVAPGAQPTFSVVIAAYQVAPFVGEAIRSALEQTRPPLEVIVCDDGSTDDLEAALEPFRDRVTVIRQENQGEGAAKDTGSRAAVGDFVAFLDGDDLYEPERLAALAAMSAARPDLDILASDAFVQVGDDVVRTVYEGDWTFEVEDQRRAILERNFILGHAAARRERLLEVGGVDPAMRTVADWDLWIRMILSGSAAGFVPEPLARWRVREGSLSTFRTDLLAGSVRALEHAAAREELTEADRRTLERSLVSWRRDFALEEAQEGLVEGRAGTWRRLLRLSIQPGLPLETRAKVLFAGIAPGIARRLLRRRHERYWIGAAEERVPRDRT